MMKRTVFPVILLAGLLAQGCENESGHQAAVAAVSIQADTLTVKPVQVAAYYTTSGTVTSDHRVSISSRISGYIRKLSVREGDHVNKGQVLVRVDPVNAKQTLVQAEADLANAKADKQRYESLFHDHAASKQQLDRVRLRYQVARSRVAQARNQLGYAEVLSPVDGVVVEKRMSKGDLASPGAAILTLEDPTSLLVNTYVSEQFVSGIHAGDSVAVDIAAIDGHITGTVRQVVEAADAVSHQFLIKVALQHHAGVHPGMYAQIGFSIGQRTELRIPAMAVVQRAGLHGVYIMDKDHIAHYRQIRIGRQDQISVTVLAGLHDGDIIAWNGTPEAVQTGMNIRPINTEPK